MITKKIFLLFTTCLLIWLNSSAQKAFLPSGKLFVVDTLKVKTMKQYCDATGNRFLAMEILNDKAKTVVYYKPLSHVPVLIFSNDSLETVKSVAAFNRERYLNSWQFGYDCRRLIDLLYTKDEIVSLLGPPEREYETDGVYKNIYYPGFSLRFTKSADPASTYLESFTKFNFTGARSTGIGISNFSINLYDSDNDYVTGFQASFLNTSKRRVKYLYITIAALNSVGDLVKKKVATAIGPIEPGDVAFYDYKDLFFTKIIETVKITGIKIQYFDGSNKLLTGKMLRKSFIESQ